MINLHRMLDEIKAHIDLRFDELEAMLRDGAKVAPKKKAPKKDV